jgi:hypothetical protein
LWRLQMGLDRLALGIFGLSWELQKWYIGIAKRPS